MAKIVYEEENGVQPWVVYEKKGKEVIFRAAFSTKEEAQKWVDKYAGRYFI